MGKHLVDCWGSTPSSTLTKVIRKGKLYKPRKTDKIHQDRTNRLNLDSVKPGLGLLYGLKLSQSDNNATLKWGAFAKQLYQQSF